MARRRKKAEDNSVAYVLLAVLGLGVLTLVPAWVWYAAIAAGALWWGWKLYQKNAGTKVAGLPTPAPAAAPQGAVWVPADHTITVAGLTILGGLLYVGKSLPARSGANDPALINTSCQVAPRGDYTLRQMDYWPSYSLVSPVARRSYLEWLAGGRSDPRAEIGFVFLFFYGLERRAVLDAANDDAAQADWPVIAQELRRLLSIYGPQSKSFRRYATDLLTWVELGPRPAKLYERPVPQFTKSAELPLYLRLGLGQASLERVPVPAEFALAWALLEPGLKLPAIAQRFAKEFRSLFVLKYRERFGQGLELPVNRTKLRFTYRPASAGFRGYDDIKMGFGDIPDVSVLTGPVQRLQEVVDAVAEALAPYGRFVGKNPTAASTPEALLLLPAPLWPPAAQEPLRQLAARMKSGLLVQTFGEAMAVFGMTLPVAKSAAHNAVRALESFNIGMEPDILAGARVPRTDDPVVLFAAQPGEPCNRATPEYRTAALTLQLGASVAMADGQMDLAEFRHLRLHIEQWSGLTPAQQQRLRAHLRLQVAAPMSLTALNKKLEPLDTRARHTLGRWLAEITHLDGAVSAAEVSALEKLYKALGIDKNSVYSDVHAAAAVSHASSAATLPSVQAVVRAAPAPAPTVPVDEPVPVASAASTRSVTYSIPKPSRAATTGPLSGLTFVITGTLSDLRSSFVELIEQAGGEVTETVSQQTSYVLAGVHPGEKLARARFLSVPVIDEIAFRTLLVEAGVDVPAAPEDSAVSIAQGLRKRRSSAPKTQTPAPALAPGAEVASELVSPPVPAPVPEKPSFQLDAARIAALQEDTARVSVLLANIFAEEPPTPAVVEAEPAPVEPEADEAAPSLLGLDAALSSFARMLLSRPHWSREELQDVAADLDVMLDGALERINEASYDAHDEPLTEGDDPVTVNQHILEKVEEAA